MNPSFLKRSLFVKTSKDGSQVYAIKDLNRNNVFIEFQSTNVVVKKWAVKLNISKQTAVLSSESGLPTS